jgi:hypothetical protein
MAYAPLVGQDGGSCGVDLPDAATEIFLREGLDRLLVICPSRYFVAGRRFNSSLRVKATRNDGAITCSPDEQSDIRGGVRVVPDIALMSFVKRFERELSPPCDFRWSGR